MRITEPKSTTLKGISVKQFAHVPFTYLFARTNSTHDIRSIFYTTMRYLDAREGKASVAFADNVQKQTR